MPSGYGLPEDHSDLLGAMVRERVTGGRLSGEGIKRRVEDTLNGSAYAGR